MVKYTAQTLLKLENLFKQLHYVVRYEKGAFQSGYCLVKDKKVIVMNKFYTTDARINCFLDILQEIDILGVLLDDEQRKFYEQVSVVKTSK